MKKAPTTVFDRILASTPMGRTAAFVTSESRDNFVSTKKITQRHSDNPFKMRQATIGEARCHSFENLTGREFGLFRVVGIFDYENFQKGKKTPFLWVCRCVCGRYETRSARAVRNRLNDQDRCDECRQTETLRARERNKALGIIGVVTVEGFVDKIQRGGS